MKFSKLVSVGLWTLVSAAATTFSFAPYSAEAVASLRPDSVVMQDTNRDMFVDTVALTFSEIITTCDADVTNWNIDASGSVTITSVDAVSCIDDTIYLSVSTYGPGTGGMIAPGISFLNPAAALRFESGSHLVFNESWIVADGAAPGILSLEYGDDDHDGQLDSLVATFSEPIASGSFDSDALVVSEEGPFTNFSIVTSGANLLTESGITSVQIPTTESTTARTGADVDDDSEFAISWTSAAFSLVDSAGNSLTEADVVSGDEVLVGGESVVLDGAAPVFLIPIYLDLDKDGMIDSIYTFFTEQIDYASFTGLTVVNAGDFTDLQTAGDASDMEFSPLDGSLQITFASESTVIDTHDSAQALAFGVTGESFVLADEHGNTLADGDQMTVPFYDGADPVVVSLTPAESATGASVNTNLTATFSESVILSALMFPVGVTAEPTSFDYELLAADTEVVINPDVALAYSTTYTVTLSDALFQPLIGNEDIEYLFYPAEEEVFIFEGATILGPTPDEDEPGPREEIDDRDDAPPMPFEATDDDVVFTFTTESAPTSGGGGGGGGGGSSSYQNKVTLVSPESGTYEISDVIPVSWTTVGAGITSVKLETSVDGGATWVPLAAGLAKASGSYDWTVGAEFAGKSVILRASGVNTDGNALAQDQSSTLIVNSGAPTVVIVGENYYIGENGQRIADDSDIMGINPVNGESEPISELMAGWYIRSENFPTVYLVTETGTRRPFWNENLFFTYEDNWKQIVWVTDATLATLPIDAPVLPNPGTVLVKIQSEDKVYVVEHGESSEPVVRHVATEELASAMFGADWADYVIDLEPTVYAHFTHGVAVTVPETVNLAVMRTRSTLASLAFSIAGIAE